MQTTIKEQNQKRDSSSSPSEVPKRYDSEGYIATKSTLFVPPKVPQINPKTMGLEYRLDVTNDAQYINKIFETNSYEHSYESLLDFYSDDVKELTDKRNVGAVIGMAALSIFGFFAFGVALVGGLAGIIFGGAIGRIVANKLADMRRKKEKITQEDLFQLKVRCMLELGKEHRKKAKQDLNKFRLAVERIIEESAPCLETSLFQKQRIINGLLFQLRNFLMDNTVQTAMLLSYRLFKGFLDRNDMNDPDNIQKAAKKINEIFISYIRVLELNPETSSQPKTDPTLAAYFKLKAFVAKPEIVALLAQAPNNRDEETLNQLKAFLAEEADISEPMKKAMSKNSQPATENLALNGRRKSKEKPSNIEIPEDIIIKIGQDSPASQESSSSPNNFHHEELGEPVNAYKAELYGSVVSKKSIGTTPKAFNFVQKNVNFNQDDPSQSEQPADLQYSKALSVNKNANNALFQLHRGDTNDGLHDVSPKSTFLGHVVAIPEEEKREERKEQENHYVKLPSKDASQLHVSDSLVRAGAEDSPSLAMKKQQSIQLSSQRVSSPTKKQTKSKEEEKKVEDVKLKISPTNKELFDRVLTIAYDTTSKWDRVVTSQIITIDKIKPEGSPVVLIRAWALIEGYSPEEVFIQIYDAKRRSLWDTVTRDLTVIEQIDEATSIITFMVKAPIGITDRDFVQRRMIQHDYPEKGSIIMGFQSFSHPNYPPLKNRVRGDTKIAGYVIKPSTKFPNSTDLGILTQVDIKGNIPKVLVNMAAGKSPAEWIRKLIGACEAERERNKRGTKI